MEPDNKPNQPKSSKTPQPVAANQKNNRWVKWLIIWLLAVPLALVLQFIARFVLGGQPDSNTVTRLINIVSGLVGIYMLLGWIPLVILIVRKTK